MHDKKNIFAIIGSASQNSSNLKLVEYFEDLTKEDFNFTVFDDLKSLPPFEPHLSTGNPPEKIINFRNEIAKADGILICTPEYVFSIPSGLKNAIEWCVSTTVFSDKPTVLITASASGEKGHEELLLIMRTVMANYVPETTLLIKGIKGKVNEHSKINDPGTVADLKKLSIAFKTVILNCK